MKKRNLATIALAATSFLIFTSQARAEKDPFNYRIEIDNNTEYTNNVEQLITGNPDLVNRTNLSATLRYTFPTNTQILLRPQATLVRYATLGENFNQSILMAPLTVSQWFIESLNVYAGLIPIYLKSDTELDIRRFDMDWMGGVTYYKLMGDKNVLFGGYQLDKFQAEASMSRYIGNSLLAGYRHSLIPDLLSLTGNARFQLRSFLERELPNEQRYVANATLRYSPLPWLSLSTKGEYTYVNADDPQRTTGFYTIGLNITAGYNN